MGHYTTVNLKHCLSSINNSIYILHGEDPSYQEAAEEYRSILPSVEIASIEETRYPSSDGSPGKIPGAGTDLIFKIVIKRRAIADPSTMALFAGSPAFLGYFLPVSFIFLIFTKALPISVPGRENFITSSSSPPSMPRAFPDAFTSSSISPDL